MLETRGVYAVDLEIRADGERPIIAGRFPYGGLAVIGTRRQERFLPGAFAATLREGGPEVNFLMAHDMARPLASRNAGTLVFEDSPEALAFEATLPIAEERTTWQRDFLLAHGQGLSNEHFTVDGTLIEAAASLKSFNPKDGDPPRTTDADPGNPSVDFHGERRGNATHQSTTDPEARLLHKGKGKEARLAFMAHALMQNRHGMLVDFQTTPATGTAERDIVPELLDQARQRGFHPRTLGGDKGLRHPGLRGGPARARGDAARRAEQQGAFQRH